MSESTAQLLDRLSSGYRDAQILFTGLRLGVFAALADGTASSADLATRLSCDPRGLRILLDALAALGVLDKEGHSYRNGAAARAHLVADAPEPRAAILAHGAKLYETWGRLDEAVKYGTPVPDDAVREAVRGDASRFADAMADVGRQSAAQVAGVLELDGVRRMLDVGGGPGLYALELARRVPELRATVLDRAETLETTRRHLDDAGLSDRVDLLPGDAFEIDWQGPYDLILASNFIHIFGPEENRLLVARAAGELGEGGRLVIKDFLLRPDRTEPVGAALFAVNMLVNTEHGDCYTETEVATWMRDAGLQPEEPIRLTEQSALLVGRRPG